MSTFWKYRSGGTAFNKYVPGNIEVPANALFRYDASDISTLYQDTGGLTPVTTDSDPVGRWNPIVSQGTNRVQPLTGFGTYFAATTYGPGVQPSVFREQVTGSGGGAVPPAGNTVRYLYVVVSDVGIANAHTLVGYGALSPTSAPFFVNADPSKWLVRSGGHIFDTPRTAEQAILQCWHDGTFTHLKVNGDATVSFDTSSVPINTLTSSTNAVNGWHISHSLTSGGVGAPSASQLYTTHECGLYDFIPTQIEIDNLYVILNSKWNGVGDVT